MNEANNLFLLLGRLAMASLFLPDAYRKIMGFQPFAASLAAKLPFPMFWAIGAVAILALGSICLVLGAFPRLSALALIAFVVMATATTHRYWELPEPGRMMQEINFYKNVALIGGLLVYMGAGPGAWSVRGSRA